MNYVVMFSGGAGSWAAARRLRDAHPDDELHLLFADTRMEDEDLYRFLEEAAADIEGATFHKIADGRTPWEVFHDVRFLGNHRIDPCSRILKRDLMRTWLEERFAPETTTVALGIDWTEIHRYERAAPKWLPYTLIAPMCDAPYLDKGQVLADLAARGIAPPRLYAMGFPHNNCGGFCVKAGHSHFKLLLEKLPEVYAKHEAEEEGLRRHLGRSDIAILTDRSGGNDGAKRRPMTLRELRLKLQGGVEVEQDDWGGCGCAVE